MIDLRDYRKKNGLTQADVEVLTDIDSSTQSLYENRVRTPTVKDAKIYGELYGFKWTEIFEDEDNDKQGI